MRARRLLLVACLMLVPGVGWSGVAHAQEAPPPEQPPPEEAPPPEQPPPEIVPEAEDCIKILEEGGEVDDCQEAPNPILPEANELIWGAISFAVLLVLLRYFAWPGLKKGMDSRSERIRRSLDEAERTRSEAKALLEDYQRQIGNAKEEATGIIDDARQTAEGVKRDLMARAEADAAEARERNATQIGAERDRVMAEVRTEVAGLAIELAEKVVEANLDRDANTRLIENYIHTVGSSSAPA